MKKITSLLSFFLLLLAVNSSAQVGRPQPIENNAPKINVRNDNDPTSIQLGKINDRLTALESKVNSLENDNASLKTLNDALQKNITELSTAQQANYKVLDYS